MFRKAALSSLFSTAYSYLVTNFIKGSGFVRLFPAVASFHRGCDYSDFFLNYIYPKTIISLFEEGLEKISGKMNIPICKGKLKVCLPPVHKMSGNALKMKYKHRFMQTCGA